jgi:type 1 fimbriae regulatory protein FimB/type 1 fimbriae regulatory protein FimE
MLPSVQVRAFRQLHSQFPDTAFVFATERGGPFTADTINRHVKRIGWRAGLPAVHPHMLQHACGYALANAGQRYPAQSRTGSAIDRSGTRDAARN